MRTPSLARFLQYWLFMIWLVSRRFEESPLASYTLFLEWCSCFPSGLTSLHFKKSRFVFYVTGIRDYYHQYHQFHHHRFIIVITVSSDFIVIFPFLCILLFPITVQTKSDELAMVVPDQTRCAWKKISKNSAHKRSAGRQWVTYFIVLVVILRYKRNGE